MDHQVNEKHEGMKHGGHELSIGRDHGDHHVHMLADFKKRFITSLVLTIPVLLLSPTIHNFFGFEFHVQSADFITFLLSSVVYFYFITFVIEYLSSLFFTGSFNSGICT